MDDAANVRTPWSLQNSCSHLTYGALSGEVDVARPSLGLRVKSLAVNQCTCTLLGALRSAESLSQNDAKRGSDSVLWPLSVADAYVRGNDLVATYGPTESWPYSPQLYWRAATLDAVEGVKASMSLLVSVQTQLLDTCPRISVVSQIPSSEMLRLAIGQNGDAEVAPVADNEEIPPSEKTNCIIRRFISEPISLIEFMSTGDYSRVRAQRESNGKSAIEWQLFAEFLEKGVIRRARVHTAVVPQDADIELALECCRVMENDPLPLTV